MRRPVTDPGGGNRMSKIMSRPSWRQCIVFSILFFAPISKALAQPTDQIIVSGSGQNYRTASPNPNVWMGPHAWSSNNTDRLARIPDSGTVSALRVVLQNAPGGGNRVTFTLRKDTGGGPVATALTCTITNNQTTCSDTGNSVAVAAGDKLDIEATPQSLPNNSYVYYTTKYVSDTARNTVLLGGSREDPLIPNLLSYVSLHGLWTSDTEFNMETVFPTGGTLRNLYVDLPTAPGVGESRTFTVRKNGAPTGLTCTISDLQTSCNDTVNTVSYTAGDTAVLQHTPSAGPAVADRSNTAVVFEADAAGSFLIATGSEAPGNDAETRFAYVSGDQNVQPVEEDRMQLAQATTIKTMYVEIDPAPDNGAGVDSWRFTLRRNVADTGLSCTISESATACTTGLDVVIADDDLLSLEVTPINLPAQYAGFHVSFCAGDRAGSCPPIPAPPVPSLSRMYDNEKTFTTTPSVIFSSTVPSGGELLQYEVEWDTVRGFIAADPALGSRRSWEDSGFTNLDDGADVDPFISGDTIRFTFPSGALTDGQTYWWRVRTRRSDTLALSAWSTPRTFTVDTAQTDYSQWHQTTSQQFVNDTLSGAATSADSPTLHVIDSGVTNADGAMHIEAVDLDGDGDTDVVTAAGGSNQFAWYENDGIRASPACTSSTARPTPTAPRHRSGGPRRRRRHRRGDRGFLSDQFAWYENDGINEPRRRCTSSTAARPTPTKPGTSMRWTSTATATPTW